MFAVVLLKAYTSSTNQRECGYSASIQYSTLELQLLLTHHPSEKPRPLSRRMKATTLVYRDPKIPEQP